MLAGEPASWLCRSAWRAVALSEKGYICGTPYLGCFQAFDVAVTFQSEANQLDQIPIGSLVQAGELLFHENTKRCRYLVGGRWRSSRGFGMNEGRASNVGNDHVLENTGCLSGSL